MKVNYTLHESTNTCILGKNHKIDQTPVVSCLKGGEMSHMCCIMSRVWCSTECELYSVSLSTGDLQICGGLLAIFCQVFPFLECFSPLLFSFIYYFCWRIGALVHRSLLCHRLISQACHETRLCEFPRCRREFLGQGPERWRSLCLRALRDCHWFGTETAFKKCSRVCVFECTFCLDARVCDRDSDRAQ